MRERRSRFVTCICLAIACALADRNAEAFGQEGLDPGGIDTVAVASYLQRIAEEGAAPGCAVGVYHHGELVYDRSFGFADLERSVPNTSTMVFQVGSIAKQFTAFSILLLDQEGLLSLDDEVEQYLPWVPRFAAPITIRNLLQHTSGIRNHWDLFNLAGWRPGDWKTADDVKVFVSAQEDLNFLPGTEYQYSNTNYTLLGMIVEQVAGLSLEAFTNQHIFAPLGMTSTRFDASFYDLVPNRALPYRADGNAGYALDPPLFEGAGSTNLYTNLSDLGRWLRNLDTGDVGGLGVVRAMATPGRLDTGETIEYGYGLEVSEYRGHATVSHSGSHAGYRADLFRLPDLGYSVACLCNTSQSFPWSYAPRIARLALPNHFKTEASASPVSPEHIALDSAEAAQRAGMYWNYETEDYRRLFVEGDSLVLVFEGQPWALTPLSSSHFRISQGPPVNVTFVDSAGGPVVLEEIVFSGRPTRFERVTAKFPTRADVAQYVGWYESTELGVRYRVVEANRQLLLRRKLTRRTFPDITLLPAYRDAFGAPGLGTVRFTRTTDGSINALLVSTNRSRRLRFGRVP